MDVLTDVLERTRARGTVFARTVMHTPWGIRFSSKPNVQFHAVLRGSCWLHNTAIASPIQLLQGDFVLMRFNSYNLSDEPNSPTEPFEQLLASLKTTSQPKNFESPGAGSETILLCGAYDFSDTPNSLLTGLPNVLHVPASAGHRMPAMRSALTILSDELEQSEPGSQTIVDRLVDMLFVYCLRTWFDCNGVQQAHWLRALKEPDICRALEAIHQHPEESWTVASLAQYVKMSRATFARRFSNAVGQPPMNYLTWWRMTIAADLLRNTDLSVSSIAERVGYNNSYAFATAFKRLRGDSPGHYRLRVLSKV